MTTAAAPGPNLAPLHLGPISKWRRLTRGSAVAQDRGQPLLCPGWRRVGVAELGAPPPPSAPARRRGAPLAADRGPGHARGPRRRSGLPGRSRAPSGDLRRPRGRPRSGRRDRAHPLLDTINGVLLPERLPARQRFVETVGVAMAYLHDIGMVDMTPSGRRVHALFAAHAAFGPEVDPLVQHLLAPGPVPRAPGRGRRSGALCDAAGGRRPRAAQPGRRPQQVGCSGRRCSTTEIALRGLLRSA